MLYLLSYVGFYLSFPIFLLPIRHFIVPTGGIHVMLEPERGFEPANLPITNRLRYPCATRAGPFSLTAQQKELAVASPVQYELQAINRQVDGIRQRSESSAARRTMS